MFEVDRPLRIETKVAQIISKQARTGVHFEKIKANILVLELTEKIAKLDLLAVPQMPKMMVKGDIFKKPFLKNGKPSKYVQDYSHAHADEEWLSCVAAPFTRVWYEDFDMGKIALVKDWLIKEGWEPEEWNLKESSPEHVDEYLEALRSSLTREFRGQYLGIDKLQKRLRKPLRRSQVRSYLLEQRKWPTSPKIPKDDEQFDHEMRNVDSDVGRLVRERLMLSHRRSLIRGLIKLVRADGRISAQANPCATPTFRMRHKGVVNIPAPRSPYGKQLRCLFSAPKGRVFMGYDASGLELRMLAHYINDPEYTEVICNGDAHTMHQEMAGLPTRDDAKTFIYAFLYGAGNAKIGSIVGGTSHKGAQLKSQFLAANPSLERLIYRVQEEAETGYLTGLDGRRIIMRRSAGKPMVHKALNTLLQAAGAVVMKYAMVFLEHWIQKEGLDAKKVIDMHDEGQYEVALKDVERVKYHMERCVEYAGLHLKMNVPLASEAKMGKNWYHTH